MMARLRLDEIEAFAAVADGGGFATAAQVLGRDASVLSRRVTALETRLGVRLLARTTRKVAVTEAGMAYLQRVRTILAELAAADEEAADRAVTPRGTLRLSLPAAFGRAWVAPLIPDFLQRYPEIRVEAHYSDRYSDLVSEGFDAAIRVGGPLAGGLVVRRLASFERLLCASPAYLGRHGVPQTPADLARHACLHFLGYQFGPDWPLQRGGDRVTVRTTGRLATDDGEALVAAAVAGCGVMLSADWLIGRELTDGRLVRVLPGWSVDAGGRIHAVLPPGRLIPAKTRVIVECLAAAFAPRAPWTC